MSERSPHSELTVDRIYGCRHCGTFAYSPPLAHRVEHMGLSCSEEEFIIRPHGLVEQLETAQAMARSWETTANVNADVAERLQQQFEALHAAALALLESADDQTHPDDGFPMEEWLNLVDAVRGSNPASSPENVTSLPVCPECAEGRHIYCLDDGSSTWTDKCRCTCREEQSPASEPKS